MQIIIVIVLKIVEIYSYLLLAYALLSWFPTLYTSNLGRIIRWLVEPIVKPLRSLPLQFLGLDWSVMVAMIALNIGTRLLLQLLYLFS